MNHIQSLEYRIKIVHAIRNAKEFMTYNDLSKLLCGDPVTVLSRYKMGRILPNLERAKVYEEKLKTLNKPEIFCDSIKDKIDAIETFLYEIKKTMGYVSEEK